MIETAVIDGGRLPALRRRRNSAAATSAEAAPPKPLNTATIWGIAVILTVRAMTAPISRADDQRDDDPGEAQDLPVEQRRDDGEQHADGRHTVAAPRGLGRAQPLQPEDEQDGREQIGQPDDQRSTVTTVSSSGRAEHPKHPVRDHEAADHVDGRQDDRDEADDRQEARSRRSRRSPARRRSEIPEIAFAPDISGVWSVGGTLVITSKPTNMARTNT